MIDITRDGCEIALVVTPDFPINDLKFSFTYNTGAEWVARLLRANIHQRQMSILTQIRREAYEQGWKDAKAHRTKKSWFSGMWKS